MIARTQCAPAAAPSVASETARQLASFWMRTGRASAASRSCCKGWPLSHSELAFLTLPVAGEIAPGMPTPTVHAPPTERSAADSKAAIVAIVAR
jgi:hypothetical protein